MSLKRCGGRARHGHEHLPVRESDQPYRHEQQKPGQTNHQVADLEQSRSEAEGDHENALKSLESLIGMQQMVGQVAAQRQEAAQEYQWRQQMEQAIGANPDVGNPDSPLYKEVDRLVNEHPYFFYLPQGFHKAVEVAGLILAAGTDSELREENERLRAEHERRDRKAQPAKGGPSKPSTSPERQEDMSLDEEESYLRNLTEQADRGR